MISKDQAQSALGYTLYGAAGAKIGKVGAVFVDDRSGDPEFASVQTGLFGRKESLVPLQRAEMDGNGISVPYDVQKVKDAPDIELDGGHMTPEEEDALFRYYGVDPTGMTDPMPPQAPYTADPALTEGRGDMSGTDAAAAAGMRPSAADSGPSADVGPVAGVGRDSTPAAPDAAEAARQARGHVPPQDPETYGRHAEGTPPGESGPRREPPRGLG